MSVFALPIGVFGIAWQIKVVVTRDLGAVILGARVWDAVFALTSSPPLFAARAQYGKRI
jgi:hypothetical protein